MKKALFSSGGPWETSVGYSRAVKVGPHIFVSGTVAFAENGEFVGIGDAYVQTKQILTVIKNTLEKAGANLNHIVRTRMYLIDINDSDKVCKAHSEYFSEIRPASTLVIVKALILPEILVEIECDALIHL